MQFKTSCKYAVTSGKTKQRTRGYSNTIEHAETIGNSLRKGTEYTIWMFSYKWVAYRTRVSYN